MSRYFNSIKVRLEHYSFLNKWMEAKFQFHKGAIRTLCLLLRYLIFPYFNSIKVRLERPARCGQNKIGGAFQFHKGAIRTATLSGLFIQDSYFNSIKVRLEQTTIPSTRRVFLFQFHKGAIRTHDEVMAQTQQTFQFHKGAIRTR